MSEILTILFLSIFVMGIGIFYGLFTVWFLKFYLATLEP